MENGQLQARLLYVGNRVEVIACSDEKHVLVVLLSSKLLDESLGTRGEIYDPSRNEVIYSCRRCSY